MSQHPVVLAAMREAIDRFGAGAGSTRNIPAAYDYQLLLEQELADLHGKDDALLYTSGCVANAAALSTLAGQIWDCIVFCDAANHASIIEGIGHSGAECQIFRHNNPVDLEERLMTVAIFSGMSKTRPDRPRDMNQLAKRIVDLSVGEETEEQPVEREKNPHAVALGKLGGQRGGKVRAERLTAARRTGNTFDGGGWMDRQ